MLKSGSVLETEIDIQAQSRTIKSDSLVHDTQVSELHLVVSLTNSNLQPHLRTTDQGNNGILRSMRTID